MTPGWAVFGFGVQQGRSFREDPGFFLPDQGHSKPVLSECPSCVHSRCSQTRAELGRVPVGTAQEDHHPFWG